MAVYQGIMAGIGDIINGVNVIPPEFDAAIRNFEIGFESGIISGMNIQGSNLTPGACIARGYVGYLPVSVPVRQREVYITQTFIWSVENFAPLTGISANFTYAGEEILSGNASYDENSIPSADLSISGISVDALTKQIRISVENHGSQTVKGQIPITIKLGVLRVVDIYARFVIHKDKSIPDEFYVMDEMPSSQPMDDILNGAGEYVFHLYFDGVSQNRYKYPACAGLSEQSEHLLNGGTIAATATVEGEIDVSDNSDRPATTKFVQDLIKKEMNANEIADTFRSTEEGGEGTYTSKISYIHENSGVEFRQDFYLSCQLKRKAKMCVGRICFWILGYRVKDEHLQIVSATYSKNTLLGKLPSGFNPKQELKLPFGANTDYEVYLVIDTNGNIKTTQDRSDFTSNLMFALTQDYNIGYETN